MAVLKLALHHLDHKRQKHAGQPESIEQRDQQSEAPDRGQSAAGQLGGIMQLQRTVGNRAVSQMLQPGSAGGAARPLPGQAASSGGADVIRRRTIVHKPAGGGVTMDVESEGGEEVKLTEEERLVKTGLEKAEEIDEVVESSYARFLKGDYEGASDAHKDLYKLRKYNYDNGVPDMHPSTAAGYVIEGMVNAGIRGKAGVRLQVTDLLPGTRPDVVIDLTPTRHVLVDITASNSAGHILDKKGNWLNHVRIPVVTESLYPSIDFSTMGETKLSEEDMAAIQQRIEDQQAMQALAEAEALQARQDRFKEIQNDITDKIGQTDPDTIARLMANSRYKSKFKMCGIKEDLSHMTFDEWNAEGFSEYDVNRSYNELLGKSM